ncbi:protein unc-13 homolog [Apium graveolens]|uniref:protein unc-13 homolog n=1 Tax=Apium graveolens TaxID=4045 RepID=UPI003D79BD27
MVQKIGDQGETLVPDLIWPFGRLEGLDEDDLCMAAYEIFFTACRSSPGFGGGRNAINFYSTEGDGGGGSPVKGHGVGMAVTSKIKRALGLKMIKKRSPSSRRTHSWGSVPNNSNSPRNSPRDSPRSSPSPSGSPRIGFTVPTTKIKRPLTSAEIMRQQMQVSEQSDNRLRKTLMRTLVGQTGRRAETIILPLELLRHLKPSEFNTAAEYHLWQRRQLKLLEAGLLVHPSIPIEKSNKYAMKLKEIITSSEIKPMDTSKNSEQMKTVCNCIAALAWRTPDNELPTGVCHWADGYPLNVHIYISLLRTIFDTRDETLVLDEVDELVELMKKTWPILGINKLVHNMCFTWVLFEQYIVTGEVEVDLLAATLAMMSEIAHDVQTVDRETLVYVKMLKRGLSSIKRWSEKKLLDYHANFDNYSKLKVMEILLPLASAVTKISEDVPGYATPVQEDGDITTDQYGNRADLYIRSSLRNAFTKMLDDGNINSDTIEVQDVADALIQIAQATQELAMKEKENYSSTLKKWHPVAAGAAAVTLHSCYGTLLKQYLTGTSQLLSNEAIEILHTAGKLEKFLVQMAVEDSAECEDGGKAIVREMVPYEVESIITRSIRQWIQERLKSVKDVLQSAKESETWNPKSKTEPYGHSAVELMKHAKQALDEFLEIPVSIAEDLAHSFAHGLEELFRDYTTFVSSCGSKKSYVPTLPALTRCNRDSKIRLFWKKASPCTVTLQTAVDNDSIEGNNNPRPSTSRGTQRLYIRLNSLQYVLSQLQVLEKTLSLSTSIVSSPRNRFNNRSLQLQGSNYFDQTRSSINSATLHVSQVAAYRLIFLDSNSVFYGGLYIYDVENARVRPALRILKQNLTLLSAIVVERIQPLAMKEVMKASFDAFLMVLLAGGASRVFTRADHPMIEEDFDHLKKVFTHGEGIVSEETVDKEASAVEGVVDLMGDSTEKLIDEFTHVACEASGIGVGVGQKLPMPPTTGKWSREDANTILRVLCHRNDKASNHFLKWTFQLPKRR